MSEETPIEKVRSGSTAPWRWMLFGLALITLMTLLTIWAMDRENVVWEHGKAFCPHCRTEVESYSRNCATCRQGYDWLPHDELCWLCFSESDVARIHAARSRLAAAGGEDADGSRARFLTWAEDIDAGDCVHCGGTGKDLFLPEGADPRPCPVCLGDGDCILCDGDEQVRRGEPRAHRDLAAHFRQLDVLSGRLGSAAMEKKAAAFRDAMGDLRGFLEIEEVAFPDGRLAIDVAESTRQDFMTRFPPVPIE